MKTQILKTAIAIIIAINFNVTYVHSQTGLSGTGSNSCGAGTYGTTNTNLGCFAGYSSTSGDRNVAIGDNTLYYNTAGDQNTAVGYQAGQDNTATGGVFVGQRAGTNNTTGDYNVFIGENCGYTNTTGGSNCFLGAAAGYTSSNCTYNDFSGYQTGYFNTSGSQNTFIGGLSGYRNTTASENTYLGYSAGYNNTGATNTVTGFQAGYGVNGSSTYANNSFFGWKAGNGTTTGGLNTCFGYASGLVNTTGNRNHFAGVYTGYANTTGAYNTFDGYNAGASNVSGTYNSFFGYNAGYYSLGDFNTYIGRQAGYNANNAASDYNTYVGHEAGFTSTADAYNTAVGGDALYTNNGGNYCTAVGVNAGGANTTGDNNTYLGYGATANAGTYSNSMALGNGATVTATDMVYIGNSSAKLYCNLGVWTGSDGRFKFNVQENVSGLDFIKRLRPVTYQVNTQQHHDFVRQNVIEPNLTDSLGESGPSDNTEFSASTSVIHAGFIAQEVEVAAAESGFVSSIVSPPANESSTYAVNYSEIVVPLVKAVQEQQDSIHNLTQRLAQLENIVNNCCNAPSGRSMGITPDNTTQVVELNYADNVILYQNTPNPFGDETVISYYLPQSVKSAKMDFFDNTGKMIKEITIDQRGNASVTIKSADLSIGIYAYSLIVDGKGIDTKKMIKNK